MEPNGVMGIRPHYKTIHMLLYRTVKYPSQYNDKSSYPMPEEVESLGLDQSPDV